MGSAQSTQATMEIKNKDLPQHEVRSTSSSVSGPQQHFISSSSIDEDSDDSEYDSDSNDGIDEEWNERLAILEDSRKLRQLAEFFLYPEKPVVTSDPFATGRNYFTRPSFPEYKDKDDMDQQREDILEDMKQLKKYAQHYLQPERPVEVDPLASCRNYFNRPSAPEQEQDEDSEERAQILSDALQLKKLAIDYLHPERPVVTSDPFAFGRNYFSRPSAPEQEEDDSEERAQILADALQFKKLAVDYLHPERPVITSDPCACGRNYFTRSSAPEQQEDESERAQILTDALQFKKLAVDYLNPERPVVTSDPFACGRNYFTRPSAPEKEEGDSEERSLILADAQQLKKLAVDYLNPEKSVVTSDPFACGRNYFTRPSAPEKEEDDSEERSLILADAQQLKKLAVDYLNPEKSVVTSDPFARGRNYFTRPSAPEEESFEDAEEKIHILEDAEQIFNYSQPVQHPYGHFVDHYCYHGGYYDPHEDEHHSQSEDHFEMDEDIDHSHEPYMVSSVETKQEPHHPVADKDHGHEDKDHGHTNLAFSPDCVMMGYAQQH
jgi:hypothetical protein